MENRKTESHGKGQDSVASPSGKNAAGENFPVGSVLLPARLRPHIMTFYAFARAADDVADNPDLDPADKLARLGRLAAALQGEHSDDPALATAHRMRQSLAETGVESRHCLDLLDAFSQDTGKTRYDDWDELIGYCDRSAAPVGRYLLDLHGEVAGGYPASDALCNALQILNHLQDCGDDYRTLDRVYIPEPWLAAEGLDVGCLAGNSSPPGLRRVIDRALNGVDELLVVAAKLPGSLRSRRLAMESATILSIARGLSALLGRRDPLAIRVKLGKIAYLASFTRAVWTEAFRSRRY